MTQVEVQDEDEKELGRFLADINCLDEIEDILGKPNLFDVLGMARTEIRHSNVLRWLLDPSGTHGFGCLFLRTFLQKLVKAGADPLVLMKARLDTFTVSREYKHIDLLLISRDPNSKIVVAIENKVDSGEHDDQLRRYQRTIESDFVGFHKEFVFLTPDGSDASESNWRTLDYNAVHDALRYCLSRVDVGSESNILLTQYGNLLEREFMNQTKLMEICNRVYHDHKRALDLIFEMREDGCSATFEMLQRWFPDHTESGLVCDEDHSSKSTVRFTSSKLLSIVPLLKDGKKSGWRSDKSAYYEIKNSKRGLTCSLSLSSANLEPSVIDTIKGIFGTASKPLIFEDGWQWKTICKFEAKRKLKDDGEDFITEEQIEKFMDRVVKEIHELESKFPIL